MKVITSRDNPFFKQLVKLAASTKQRRAADLVLLDGVHLVSAYRRARGLPENVIVSESGYKDAEIMQLLAERGERQEAVTMLSDALFRQISPVKTPIGIMALVPILSREAIPVHGGENFCVLLEAIQDPGNVGSILRSAAAAGASDVYLSDGCADAWSPKTLRAAMGAHFMIRIHEQVDLLDTARNFDGRVIAANLKAKQNLYQAQLIGPVAFVFGNEGAGLSEEILGTADEQITIPMPGGTESLNAAAAAAVCFFERVRQLGAGSA